MTEEQLQNNIIELARTLGWRVAHFRAGMNRRGTWQTPVAADSEGFPDLVLVKPGRPVAFFECKKYGKNPSPKQKEWLDTLQFAKGVIAAAVYPEDWDWVVKTLRGE